jgi:hypothetical protein
MITESWYVKNQFRPEKNQFQTERKSFFSPVEKTEADRSLRPFIVCTELAAEEAMAPTRARRPNG